MHSKKGMKFDSEKNDYSLIPPRSMDELAEVLTAGAKKYERDNWKKVEDGENRYFAAALRHLWAIRNGEINDEETGIPHAIHAAANCFFLREIMDSD